MALGSFLRVAVSIATALAKLNKRGLVHKDLRPTHILVNRADQQVRLSGYGVAFAPAARALEDDAARTKPRRPPVTKWRGLAAAYQFCQYFEQTPQPCPSLNAPDSFNAALAIKRIKLATALEMCCCTASAVFWQIPSAFCARKVITFSALFTAP
jgi:hypothetical protein